MFKDERHFRTLADSLPQLVWTALPDGRADYFNTKWQEQTGHHPHADDSGWHRLVHPDDRDVVLGQWNSALSRGSIFQTECRLGTPDASRWHLCRAIPVRGPDGAIVRWFGSCTDIHDQRETADALRRSKEQLQRTNFDLEQFAYAASHDLQEPLRMVLIYAELLKQEYGDVLKGKGETYLNFAVDGAIRMEAVIKGLLAYSSVAGPSETPPGGTCAAGALQSALTNLTIQIERSGAVFSINPLPRVNLPEVHLMLVFQNLIGNAIKYRSPERSPEIIVSAAMREGEWIFSVADNGVGIDPQYRQQIFQMFKRLHGAGQSGTGIGLALCQRLIARHAGRIWVESGPGQQGSTFLFTVPAR